MSQAKIRVLLVDDITDTRENMKKLLFFEDDIEVVGSAGTGEEGIALAKQLNPDVVIMDINMPGIDGISAAAILTREVPGIQIIMMSVQGEADYLRRSMLAGAREFLIKPPSAEQIVTSIRRVYELKQTSPIPPPFAPSTPQAHPTNTPPPVSNGYNNAYNPAAPYSGTPQAQSYGRAMPEPEREGQLIALFGSKGGVGTTSLGVNLAIAIQQQRPTARIAILDCNTEFGDLAVLLNLNVNRNLLDLIDVEELEAQYVNDIFIPHTSGIKVLPNPSPTQAELVTGDKIKKVLPVLRRQFDFVFFDTRPTFTEPVLSILDNADTVLLITTADIPSIRNARLFFEVVEQLQYPAGKVKLILNKYDPGGSVTAQAIQTSIKHPLLAEIPRDDRAVGHAIQQGLPYVMANVRNDVSAAVIRLARTFTGVTTAEAKVPNQAVAATATPPTPMASPPSGAVPRKRSLLDVLFGRKTK
jgi:pilus assembly protein CpaE